MPKDSIAALFVAAANFWGVAHGESAPSPRTDCHVAYRSDWADGVDSRLRVEAASKRSIVTTIAKEYNGIALRARMQRDDDFRSVANGVPRAEINFSPVVPLKNGRDYWITWSIATPADYRIDTLQPEIVSQIHQSSREIGSPPFSLMIDGFAYQVDVRGGRGTPSNSYRFGSPLEDRGRIVRWVLHYRPDHSGEAAVVELYKDGVSVVRSIGFPDAYEEELNGYFKIGIYKWWWLTRPSEVSVREVYFGDVEIADCTGAGRSR